MVDRSRASLDPRAAGGSWRIPEAARPGESVGLRVLVDHSVAEIFLDDGRALTLRFYPTGAAPWRLQARTTAGSARVEVSAWQLGSLRDGRPQEAPLVRRTTV